MSCPDHRAGEFKARVIEIVSVGDSPKSDITVECLECGERITFKGSLLTKVTRTNGPVVPPGLPFPFPVEGIEETAVEFVQDQRRTDALVHKEIIVRHDVGDTPENREFFKWLKAAGFAETFPNLDPNAKLTDPGAVYDNTIIKDDGKPIVMTDRMSTVCDAHGQRAGSSSEQEGISLTSYGCGCTIIIYRSGQQVRLEPYKKFKKGDEVVYRKGTEDEVTGVVAHVQILVTVGDPLDFNMVSADPEDLELAE